MIEKYLSQAQKPCVFFSGGVDSLLVLSKVRELKKDISVVTFRHDMPDHQWKLIARVIKKWDLQVMSWPPSHAYFVPSNDGIAYVNEFSLNGLPVPLVRDIIPGNKCSLEFDSKRLPVMPFDHDVIFVGTRHEDSHYATGQPLEGPVKVIGPLTFVAPFWFYTKEQIMELAQDLPFSKEFYYAGMEDYDTGNLPACTNCLAESNKYVFCPKETAYIPTVKWDRRGMLDAFQNKFGFEVNT